MEIKAANLGASLPVPCVQELAKENLISVPPRYICSDQQQQNLLVSDHDHHSSLCDQIPVIDMHRILLQSEGAFVDSELEKLHLACKHWGFFQLINHGVESELIEKVKREIEEFFKLPMEEKKKYWQRPGEIEGFGQAFVVSHEQKLDWADLFYLVTLPPHLRKPHLFSHLPPPFRATLELYSSELKKLAMKILQLMGKCLKMEENEVNELFEEGMQSMRMNYYPPCPQPELVTGLTPHSDGAGLTILLQVNEMEGLQIKKDGLWLPVKPLPNAFVVNIGDILEIVTNGIYRSIQHRAMVNAEKERISVATFYLPKLDGDMGPSRSLITAETRAKFKKMSVVDFLRGFFSRELKQKAYLDTLRIHTDQIE